MSERELSCARYVASAHLQKVRIGEICSVIVSQLRQKDLDKHDGSYPIFGASGFLKNIDFYQIETEGLAIVKDGAGVGRVMRMPAFSAAIGTLMIIQPKIGVSNGYLYYTLTTKKLASLCTGTTIPHLYFRDFKDIQISLPPLAVQRQIEARLDRICEIVTKREAQLAQLQQLVKSRFVEAA